MMILKCDWCGREIEMSKPYTRIKTTDHTNDGPEVYLGIKGGCVSKKSLNTQLYDICTECTYKFVELMNKRIDEYKYDENGKLLMR